MQVLAHFEDRSSSSDRRRLPRRALKLGVGAGGEAVVIHDLSLTGALLETSTAMLVGATFEVELPHAGAVEAVIVWNSGEFYGCQFSQPISPTTLSAALLQSAPRSSHEAPPPSGDALAELRELNAEVERLAGQLERALQRLTRK
jgi:hypothetical protein